MTTYVLSLIGDEEKTANATHWATFRKAKLVSISRSVRARSPVDMPCSDNIVITGHGAVDQLETRRASLTRHPQALAALLVRTLDIQDGAGVVLADFDSEEFAADVVTQIAALGRDVRCSGARNFAFSAGVGPRSSRA
ncbi:MAG: hypothetical protein ABIR54_12470 [Burkholderiaceae bacterium]|jgi:hypothetical protein